MFVRNEKYILSSLLYIYFPEFTANFYLRLNKISSRLGSLGKKPSCVGLTSLVFSYFVCPTTYNSSAASLLGQRLTELKVSLFYLINLIFFKNI